MAWANTSGIGLICAECFYVHTFLGAVKLWKPEEGYPTPAPSDAPTIP